MIVKLIKNEGDYRAVLARIDALNDPDEGSEACNLLDVLVALVEAYEAKHHPMSPPDPIAAIEYETEKRGLRRQNLETEPPAPAHDDTASALRLQRERRRTHYTLSLDRSPHDKAKAP